MEECKFRGLSKDGKVVDVSHHEKGGVWGAMVEGRGRWIGYWGVSKGVTTVWSEGFACSTSGFALIGLCNSRERAILSQKNGSVGPNCRGVFRLLALELYKCKKSGLGGGGARGFNAYFEEGSGLE